MQLLSAAIDLLIVLASSRRIPSLPVLLKRSEPAKSTIVSNALRENFFFTCGPSASSYIGIVLGVLFRLFIVGSVLLVYKGDIGGCLEPDAPAAGSDVTQRCSTRIYNTAWERLEFLFIPV